MKRPSDLDLVNCELGTVAPCAAIQKRTQTAAAEGARSRWSGKSDSGSAAQAENWQVCIAIDEGDCQGAPRERARLPLQRSGMDFPGRA